MSKETWDNKYDVKTVSAKLSRHEFTRFKKHCELKGIKPSTQIKQLIKDEIESTVPHMIAGKNTFSYNKFKDNFSWSIILDSGLKIEIDDNLSSEFVSQLFNSIKQVLDERNTYIKKSNDGNIPIPSKILRREL